MSVKARGSITLIRVNDGEDGNDAITVSPTAPSNPVTGQLWQTASGNPIKRWDGSKWVVHYILLKFKNRFAKCYIGKPRRNYCRFDID